MNVARMAAQSRGSSKVETTALGVRGYETARTHEILRRVRWAGRHFKRLLVVCAGLFRRLKQYTARQDIFVTASVA